MPGLLRGVARTAVVAGTASSVAGRVNHRQQKKWARKDAADAQAEPQQQEYYEQQPQSQESQAQHRPVSADDQLEQLERLSDLKDKGVLTDAEFQQKKAEILRG